MKRILILFLIVSFSFPSMAQQAIDKEKTSTYYFIRHAEKNKDDVNNKNPHLIEKGILRALKWSYVFEKVKFDAIYSTDYYRTKETATPTADKNNLEITIYDPRNIDAQAFIEATKSQTVLVVGHSNSTPSFVNKLLGEDKYEQIDESNNANLYIVTILPTGEIVDHLLVIE